MYDLPMSYRPSPMWLNRHRAIESDDHKHNKYIILCN